MAEISLETRADIDGQRAIARVLDALRRGLLDAAPNGAAPTSGAPAAIRERRRALEFAANVVAAPRGLDASAANPPAAIPHVVVFGPTQAGKSSVVNALVGAELARVSPLAGFTVRPTACVHAPSPIEFEQCHWLAGMRPAPPDAAISTDEFCVAHVMPSAASSPLLSCVVWDTPDFDSLAADQSQAGLLRALAIADVMVLVVSKEKYADLSVWRMLRLLAELRRPFVVVLNKLTPEAEAVVPAAFRARLEALGPAVASASLVPLPQVEGDASARTAGLLGAARGVREAIARAAEALPADGERSLQRRLATARWLRAHWAEWVAPLRAEHAAIAAWQAAVDEALREFLETYRRDFLDDPRRYDCFRRATVELLRLLEVPGVSNALATTRAVVTWPARRLFEVGRDWLASVRRDGAGGAPRGAEELVLQAALDRLLTHLRHICARGGESTQRGAADVWSAIAAQLDQNQQALRAELAQHLTQHAAAAQREIESTAEELYAILQKNPAALGGLRATRVVADAAGLVIAFKTGGIHVHDLFLAPAMLAATSLLGEGVLGTYMSQSAAALKQRLLADVREQLVARLFRPTLARVAEGLRGDGLIGVTPAECEAAEAEIRVWESAR